MPSPRQSLPAVSSFVLIVIAWACPALAAPAERDARVRYAELVRAGQPDAGDNAFDLIPPAAARLKELAAEHLKAIRPDADPADLPLTLGDDGEPVGDQETTKAVLRALERTELPSLMAAIASAPRAELPITEDLLIYGTGDFKAVRQLARYHAGRMTVLAEDGDWEGVARVYGQGLTLARQCAMQPDTISVLVSAAVAALVDSRALQVVRANRPDARALAALAEVAATPADPDSARLLQGEHLMALDALEAVAGYGPAALGRRAALGDPERPAGLTLKPESAKPMPDVALPGFPRRADHVALIDEYYARMTRHLRQPMAQRSDEEAAELAALQNRSFILRLSTMPKVYMAVESGLARRAGARTLLALERARLLRGGYPESLAALVPEFLPVLPADPFTGKPLCYRPPSAGPFEGERPFVLYSAGPDGVDDGGRIDFANPANVFRRGADGRPTPGDLLLEP